MTRLKWWSKNSSVVTHIYNTGEMKNFTGIILFIVTSNFTSFSRIPVSFRSGDYLASDCRKLRKKESDGLSSYIASRFPSAFTKSPRLEFHQRVNRYNPRFCFNAGLQSEHDWQRLRIVILFVLRMIFCSLLENEGKHYVAFKSKYKKNCNIKLKPIKT